MFSGLPQPAYLLARVFAGLPELFLRTFRCCCLYCSSRILVVGRTDPILTTMDSRDYRYNPRCARELLLRACFYCRYIGISPIALTYGGIVRRSANSNGVAKPNHYLILYHVPTCNVYIGEMAQVRCGKKRRRPWVVRYNSKRRSVVSSNYIFTNPSEN